MLLKRDYHGQEGRVLPTATASSHQTAAVETGWAELQKEHMASEPIPQDSKATLGASAYSSIRLCKECLSFLFSA
jgi:hypothetical protein